MAIDLDAPEFKFLLSQMKKGNVVLFCGAGFSVDATNNDGKSPPLGRALAKQLADAAGLNFDGEPLPIVYNAVEPIIGSAILRDHLRKGYIIAGYAPWYDAITEFVWNRIYTTNIDNLLDKIYSSKTDQELETIVCPDHDRERDQLLGQLQVINLHGHVHQLDRGVTFTLEEFADQQAGVNPWYQNLIDDLYNRPIVFVGSLMEESPFQHYLA